MNTRFTFNRVAKSSLCVLSLALAAAPLATHAAPADGLDACVKAFVATSLPKEQPITVRKETLSVSPLDTLAGTYKVTLVATGATSGKRFAKGTCVISRSGEVVTLNGRSVQTQVAQAGVAKTAAR
jgi:hypothetical protein